MINGSLVKALDKYLEKKNCEGAFYINGPWGSGKTYFIKNYIAHSDKNIQYISLDGMKTIGDINEELFTKFHPKLSKAVNSKIFKNIFGAGCSYVENKTGLPLTDFGLEDFINKTNDSLKALVLDDLERTNIDIQELFGYIVSLLTVNNAKVILIGNDNEVRNYLQSVQHHNNRLIAAILYNKNLEEFKNHIEDISEPLLYDKLKEKAIYKQYNFPRIKTLHA